MNVLFVDIDGVLNSYSNSELINERMVKALSIICRLYNCKVVIESTHKPRKSDWEEESPLILKLYEMIEKYQIELLGFTPKVEIHNNNSIIEDWKEYEIHQYLLTHNDIEHFAIIDDNDHIDLEMFKDYLVETKNYVENHPEQEGLTEEYIEQIGKILEKENIYRRERKNINAK